MALSPTSAHGSSSSSSGVGTMLFDSLLSGSAASIDTGAGIITSGGYSIRILLFSRTDIAGALPTVTARVNNDASAIYDLEEVRDLNGTVTGGNVRAATGWALVSAGAGSDAGSAAAWVIDFLGYDGTTFHKSGIGSVGVASDTGANNLIQPTVFKYRSTTAITRFAVSCSSNFLAGSRLTVLKF